MKNPAIWFTTLAPNFPVKAPAFALMCTAVTLMGCERQAATEVATSPAVDSAQPAKTQAPADYVFKNARIYTVDEDQPWAEALAVRGNEIVYVGSSAGAETFQGDDTRIVDVHGRLMLPGIIDTHSHPINAGELNTLALDLFPHMDKSKAEILEMIRQHAETLGPNEWVVASGIAFPVIESSDREELDAVTGGRPAVITSFAHDGWYNTRALELLGIDENTPDPEGGHIEKREDGTPTGYLGEGANFAYLRPAKRMAINEQQMDASLAKAMEMANAQGITSMIEASSYNDYYDAPYRRLHDRGALTVRFSVNMVHDQRKTDEDNLQDLLARRLDGDDYLQISSVKFYLDGVPGLTAAMFEPYLDGSQHSTLYPQDRMNKVFDQVSEAGLRIYVHAEGDYASYAALEALKYADQHGKPLGPDARAVLTHIDHLRLEDIPTMAAMNVLASIQPHWAASNEFNLQVTFPNITDDLKNHMFPNQEMLDAGVHVSCGADWPTSKEWTPWELIEIGRTRTQIGGIGGKLAGQVLALEDLIRCFTIEGAYAMFQEDITGSLETGKRADLIILDNDLFETEVTDIHNTTVALTLFDGKVVHGSLEQL